MANASPSSARPLTLLQAVRAAIRRKHYSYRTEKCYLFWVRQFLRCHGRRHPRQMGAPTRVSAFERRELTESTLSRHRRFFRPTDRCRCKRPFADFVGEIRARVDRTLAEFKRRRGQESDRPAALKERGRALAA